MSVIVPIILAGGIGMRLWPLSRKHYPKQFLRLMGKHSLLQQTVLRIANFDIDFSDLIITCTKDHYSLCADHIREIGQSAHFIIEPCLRNTLPAIAASVYYAMRQYGEDVITLVLPSDHNIGDSQSFHQACQTAIQIAKNHQSLLVFGIKPNLPHTGYGYILSGMPFVDGSYIVDSFLEKPNKDKAKRFLEDGGYFWNSGMFVFCGSVFVEQLKINAIDTYLKVQRSVNQGVVAGNCFYLDKIEFSRCQNQSIDYAIMEKTNKLVMLPIDIQWTDLGCWNSVAMNKEADSHNNVVIGDVKTHATYNCYLHSEDKHLSTLGLDNHIVVNTKDSILVAHKDFSQNVRDLVKVLQFSHQNITQTHTQVYCSWGHYEILLSINNICVRLLVLNPGARLALQAHQYRDEHWIVIEGEASVLRDDRTFVLPISYTIDIPKLSKHQLVNRSNQELRMIEVQFGARLEDHDVIFYDDAHAHSQLQVSNVL